MQWGRCKKRIFLSQWANGPIQIVCKMKRHGQKILYDLSTLVTLFLTENSSTYALMIENTFRIEEDIVKDCRIRHMSVKKSFSKFLNLYTYFPSYEEFLQLAHALKSWFGGSTAPNLLMSGIKIPKIPCVTKRGRILHLISDLNPRPKDCV